MLSDVCTCYREGGIDPIGAGNFNGGIPFHGFHKDVTSMFCQQNLL